MRIVSKYNEVADQTNPALALRPIARFAIVGCAKTAVDFAIFSILVFLCSYNAIVANSVSYLFGVLCSYSLNRIWTFSDRVTSDKIRELALFIIVNGCTLLVSNFAILA